MMVNSWDESMATKVMAEEATKNGGGEEDCLAHAVQVVLAASDPAAFKGFPQEAADAVLANTNCRIFMKNLQNDG